jgi:uracil-DNA glycosylase
MKELTALPHPWIKLLTASGMSGICDAIVDIERTLNALEKNAVIFPLSVDRYRALAIPPEFVKVVIVGQDPYHGLSTIRLKSGKIHSVPEAMGLSFSVPKGVKIPPSLRNIFKELNQDVDCPIPDHGDLTRWADQGVLLLNRLLSVEKDKPSSHKNLGWQIVTEALIASLSQMHPGIVFILWGNHAKSLRPSIADNRHTIIESSHPSPIGGSCNKGFFGSRPFSRANEALANAGKQKIDWRI